MNINMILILLSVIPSIILGLIVYNNDRVEKEPKNIISGLFIAGVAVVALVLAATEILETIFPFFSRDIQSLKDAELFVSIFFGIALLEEGGKWLVFKKLAWNNKEFDYMYDAIVYAVFISLGFATIENLLYVVEGGLWVALARAICSVPGHVFFAIYMGYYFGLAKQAEINNKNKIAKKKLVKSLLVPTLIHTFFNFCLFTSNENMIFVYLIFVLILYINSFKKVKQLSSINVKMEQKI